VRLVFGFIHQRGAEIGRCLPDDVGRNQQALAQRRQPWVAIVEAVLGRADAVPRCEHAERVERFDRHLGAQLVECKLLDEVRNQCLWRIDEEPAAIRGRRFYHEKIHKDFALGGQQRCIAGMSRRQRLDIRGDQVVQEGAGGLAGNPQDAAICEQGCFHGRGLARFRSET
jgi:hypothetical protein